MILRRSLFNGLNREHLKIRVRFSVGVGGPRVVSESVGVFQKILVDNDIAIGELVGLLVDAQR